MASKLIFLVLLVGAAQVSHGSVLDQMVNSTVTAIQSQLSPLKQAMDNGIAQGKGLLQGLGDKAQEMVQNAEASVQQLVQGFSGWVKQQVDNAVQMGKNISTCVSDQAANAANIPKKIATDVGACANSTLQPLASLVTDMENLGGQFGQLVQQVPGQAMSCVTSGFMQMGGCALQLTTSVISRANMLVSALRDDTVRAATIGTSALPQLAVCGGAGVQSAQSQLQALQDTIKACVQSTA